jgi:Ni/Co efflux regulator RcnB
MERLRTRSAALVVALLLLLSVAGVAGAANIALPAAPQAQDQVENDQGENEQGADEDTEEDTTQDEDTDEDTTEDTTQDTSDGAQGEHGALVSAVAQNKECVGGPNENHGWAVSQVARGLLVPDVLTGCPVWVPTLTTQTTDTTDVTTSHGKSAEHRKDKAHKAKHNSGD